MSKKEDEEFSNQDLDGEKNQSIGARGRNRTGTTFLSRQILNLLCLPISPLGPALTVTAALFKSRQAKF